MQTVSIEYLVKYLSIRVYISVAIPNNLFSMPIMALAVSAMFILLMSGFILYQTSLMVHGGETNYIMATISLYVSIYNLFLSLLQILGALSGNRN